MNNNTPAQNLDKACRELWSAIHLVVAAQRQIVRTSRVWADLVDVENVLREAVKQLAYAVARDRGSLEKPLNIRQAEEFALKAKVAKERLAAAGALKFVRDDQSHK